MCFKLSVCIFLPLVTKTGNTNNVLCHHSRFYHTAGHPNGPWLWSDVCQCLCRAGSHHQRLQRWDFQNVCSYLTTEWEKQTMKAATGSAFPASLTMLSDDVQRVLVWSIPWTGTCCGPWTALSAACGLVSSSPPPRETAWSTMTRDSSASSAWTANCSDTWRWRTALRWGDMGEHVCVKALWHMCTLALMRSPTD